MSAQKLSRNYTTGSRKNSDKKFDIVVATYAFKVYTSPRPFALFPLKRATENSGAY